MFGFRYSMFGLIVRTSNNENNTSKTEHENYKYRKQKIEHRNYEHRTTK